jgi:selenocysteine-specific translation elongation factor
VLENQKVFTLVQVNGASDRTIGVITKCDRVEETHEEKIREILSGISFSAAPNK